MDVNVKSLGYISELRNNSLHAIKMYYTITPVSVILYNKRTSFERGLLYTFISPNKQLNHRFLHFVVSLQSKFYTLAPTFVFDVNIYFSSLRLLTIKSVLESSTSNTSTIFALSLPLRWLSATLVLNCHCNEKIFDSILNTTEQHFDTSHNGVFSFSISCFVLEILRFFETCKLGVSDVIYTHEL